MLIDLLFINIKVVRFTLFYSPLLDIMSNRLKMIRSEKLNRIIINQSKDRLYVVQEAATAPALKVRSIRNVRNYRVLSAGVATYLQELVDHF